MLYFLRVQMLTKPIKDDDEALCMFVYLYAPSITILPYCECCGHDYG